MVTAVFKDDDYARVTGLWQWDYGQKLRIEGLRLPTAVEIHFSLAMLSGATITRVGTTKDGVTEVVIPDSLLENQTAGASTYEIYAWIYLAYKETGETIKRISMQVKRRPKPEPFDTPGDAELFREAIEAVNASADRAETAREGAEAAQKAAEEAANKIEGEITGAEKLAEQVKKDAEAVAQDKQAVSQMVEQTTQNAQNAARSAQAAENSSNAAKQAQTAAENAGEEAKAAMEATEKNRTEVAENRKAVEQAKEAVATDRRTVENTALQFEQAAQNALTAVGQAQGDAVGAVSAEGDKQVGRVQDAAAGIVADREQIETNKAEIASLRQSKADAIVETVAGEIVTAPDSSGAKLEGFRVFGKSTQVQTTGAQLLPNDLYKKVTTQGVTIELNNCVVRFNGTFTDDGTGDRPVLDVWINKNKFIGKTLKLVSDHPESYMVFRVTNINGESKYDVVEATIDETVKEVVARFFYRKTKPLSGTVINETQKVMLCESKHKELPWEPYTGGKPSPSMDWEQPIVNAGESGSIGVKVTGRNLFPLTEDNIIKNVALTAVINLDGAISISGTPSRKYESVFSTKLMDFRSGTYYLGGGVFEKGKMIVQLNIVRNDDTVDYVSNKSFELKEGDKKRVLSIQYSNDELISVNQIIYPILVHGTEGVPFEPYVEPKFLPLATPNGLPGIPVISGGNYTDSSGQQWVCDEIDLGRGKYVQRVEVVKANDLTWKADFFGEETNRIYRYSTSAIPDLIDRLNGLSNCFRYRTGSSIKANEFVVEESGRLRVVFETPFESIEALMEWFRQKETVFYLPKSTPIERDFTPEELAAYEALHTNYLTTVITNDARAHMEVSYVADTKAYINKILNQGLNGLKI